MTNSYKIIPTDEVKGNLSEIGLGLLSRARLSNDGKKVLRCINHPQERISLIFKDGFDYLALLNKYPTLNSIEALKEMDKPEWSKSGGGDI